MNIAITVLMLTASNVFMNFAWYGHLKYKEAQLYKVILISWGIAFFEYLIMVPANRIGSLSLNVFQLKIIQEVITITVFVVIGIFYFKESLRWNYIVGFCLVIAAAYFVFNDWK